MANKNAFPQVRGRVMRVTRLDGCGNPVVGTDSKIVTEGIVTVALTANVTDAEAVTVTNFAGKKCVNDPGSPTFDGYTVEVTFCEVQPCLFAMITGQAQVYDHEGDVVGFRMNSKVDTTSIGWALEVWMGVPGVACEGDTGAFGYLLLPFLSGGVLGDFTIENGAITFSVSGVTTRDGNAWGTGPYEVVLDEDGDEDVLPYALDVDDHLHVQYTEMSPPAATDGCVALAANPAATGATAGIPGEWTPEGSTPPATVAALIAGDPETVVASPSSNWTAGQYVQTATEGTAGRAHWNGTAWVTGAHP
jgi:hypothetical protein